MLFLKLRKCKHEWYHGSLLTYHEGDWGGVSLGMFIFVNGKREDKWIKDARVHEYGHTVQSLILGPLYLFVIGIPSGIWCNSPKYIKLREEQFVSYYRFYTESWANSAGAFATGEELPDWADVYAAAQKVKSESKSSEKENV